MRVAYIINKINRLLEYFPHDLKDVNGVKFSRSKFGVVMHSGLPISPNLSSVYYTLVLPSSPSFAKKIIKQVTVDAAWCVEMDSVINHNSLDELNIKVTHGLYIMDTNNYFYKNMSNKICKEEINTIINAIKNIHHRLEESLMVRKKYHTFIDNFIQQDHRRTLPLLFFNKNYLERTTLNHLEKKIYQQLKFIRDTSRILSCERYAPFGLNYFEDGNQTWELKEKLFFEKNRFVNRLDSYASSSWLNSLIGLEIEFAARLDVLSCDFENTAITIRRDVVFRTYYLFCKNGNIKKLLFLNRDDVLMKDVLFEYSVEQNLNSQPDSYGFYYASQVNAVDAAFLERYIEMIKFRVKESLKTLGVHEENNG